MKDYVEEITGNIYDPSITFSFNSKLNCYESKDKFSRPLYLKNDSCEKSTSLQ